jgi:hypothetical protein
MIFEHVGFGGDGRTGARNRRLRAGGAIREAALEVTP